MLWEEQARTKDRVREVEGKFALALGVRVAGAAVDASFVDALPHVLAVFVKGLALRPALRPWDEDEPTGTAEN